MFGTMPPSIEYIRAGKLRALAVTTAMRSAALPDIPTAEETEKWGKVVRFANIKAE
jgi:tripartite-type tricarboxylate transporter receptor subunit TctC